MQCLSCQWWGNMEGGYGTCHRHPPTYFDPDLRLWIWPETFRDDFCGDYSERDSVAPPSS